MRDGRDLKGVSHPCRIHRGGSEGADPAIYAGPLAIKKDTTPVRYCINCGIPLNWLNAKKNSLCHSCQAKWHDGLIVLVVKNNVLGVRQESIWEDLRIVKKIFKNGRLKLKF